MFGSPATAGQGAGATNPAVQLYTNTFSLTGNGAQGSTGVLDISAFSGIGVQLLSTNNGGTMQPLFEDAMGNVLLQFPNAFTYLVGGFFAPIYYRALAPFVNITITNNLAGTGTHTVTVFGTNMPADQDGPRTLLVAGNVLNAFTGALAANANGTTTVQPVVCRAFLSVFGVNLGVCWANLERVSDGLVVASTGGTTNGGASTTEIQVPSVPCRIRAINGATAQTVTATLVTA